MYPATKTALNGYQFNDLQIKNNFVIASTTAIYRKTLSAPLKMLIDKNLIELGKSTLHFGKGKAIPDCVYLKDNSASYAELDIGTANAAQLLGQHYKTVISIYVLNVLPPENRNIVWTQLAETTDISGGKAYVAVRSSKDRGIVGTPFQDGVTTKKVRKVVDANNEIVTGSTFQKAYEQGVLKGEAELYFKNVKYLCEKGAFHIVECSHF